MWWEVFGVVKVLFYVVFGLLFVVLFVKFYKWSESVVFFDGSCIGE